MGRERLRYVLASGKVGSWFADLRDEQGMTQAELAHRCGTAQSAISRFETDRVSPSIETLDRYARGMGLELYIGVAREE